VFLSLKKISEWKFIIWLISLFQWVKSNMNMNIVWLVLSGLLVALSGLFARITAQKEIENWFVFAAGVSNLVAIGDIKDVAFLGKWNKPQRIMLTLELVLFSFVLGIDIKLGLKPIKYSDVFLLISACCVVIISLLWVAASETPQMRLPFLVSAMLLVASLYLIPALIVYIMPYINHLLGEYKWWNNVVHDRMYSYIHLFIIPFAYFTVDYYFTKTGDTETKATWEKYLPNDITFLLVGIAIMISGFSYAYLNRDTVKPLYEAGAAAVMLLVGNAWYVKVKSQQ